MSEWIDIDKYDITIDGENIDIFFESNDFGSQYITIKLNDIEKLIKKDDKSLSVDLSDKQAIEFYARMNGIFKNFHISTFIDGKIQSNDENYAERGRQLINAVKQFYKE
jgi:hypothetical protein